MSSNDSDALSDEMRARRAWGLAEADTPRPQQHVKSGQPRHRFVQEGEVPVVTIKGSGRSVAPTSGIRIAELEAALEAEHAARATVMRALEEAKMLIQSLQTRLADAEVVAEQTIATQCQARVEAETALRQAATATDDLPDGPLKIRVGTRAQRPRNNSTGVVTSSTASRPKMTKQQPVKWWVPGYRAKHHTE